MVKVVCCQGQTRETRLIPDNVTMDGVLDLFDLNLREWNCYVYGEALDEESLSRPLYSFAMDSVVCLNALARVETVAEMVAVEEMTVVATAPDQPPVAAEPAEEDPVKKLFDALLTLRVAVNNAITAMEARYVSAEELPF